MRVDEARSDDRAVEIVGRARRLACTDLGDEAVLDPQPAVRVLGAGVVHRDDSAVAEDHARLERNELEPVDVDQPAVGELQRRDHGQREEGQVLERRFERAAELAGRGGELVRARDHLLERRVREQPRDRERELREHVGAVDDDDPAAPVGEAADGGGHRRVVQTDDDDVVRVVRDRRGDAPRSSPKPRTKPSPTRPVPRWRSTTAIFARSRSGSATASPARAGRSTTSVSVTIWPGTIPITRAGPPDQGTRNISGPKAPMRTVWRTQSGTTARGKSATGLPAFRTRSGRKRLEVRQHQQIGAVGGSDRAEAAQVVPQGRVERRADERVLRRDAEGHGVAHHPVDMAVGGDVLGFPVVGAERDPAGAVLREQRQQRFEVARRGRLPDQEPHAGAQALASLLGRVRLVVGADPRGGIGVERPAEDAGCVPVDVRREAELLELGVHTADDAGEVHHLGEPDHAPAAEERVEIARPERTPR